MQPPFDRQNEFPQGDGDGVHISAAGGASVSSARGNQEALITPPVRIHDKPDLNPRKTLPPISIDGVVPHIITKRPLIIALGEQSSVIDRLFWAARNRPELGWLDIYRWGSKGRETLIWRESADRACERILLHGEMPPELPVGNGVRGANLRAVSPPPSTRLLTKQNKRKGNHARHSLY